MNHPAIDPDAVSRLKRRLERSNTASSNTASATAGDSILDAAGTPAPTDGSLDHHGVGGEGAAAAAKARTIAAARRVAVPLVARFRHELDRAVGRELVTLRTEVDQLRREVARTGAEHAAAIAALQEERQPR